MDKTNIPAAPASAQIGGSFMGGQGSPITTNEGEQLQSHRCTEDQQREQLQQDEAVCCWVKVPLNKASILSVSTTSSTGFTSSLPGSPEHDFCGDKGLTDSFGGLLDTNVEHEDVPWSWKMGHTRQMNAMNATFDLSKQTVLPEAAVDGKLQNQEESIRYTPFHPPPQGATSTGIASEGHSTAALLDWNTLETTFSPMYENSWTSRNESSLNSTSPLKGTVHIRQEGDSKQVNPHMQVTREVEKNLSYSGADEHPGGLAERAKRDEGPLTARMQNGGAWQYERLRISCPKVPDGTQVPLVEQEKCQQPQVQLSDMHSLWSQPWNWNCSSLAPDYVSKAVIPEAPSALIHQPLHQFGVSTEDAPNTTGLLESSCIPIDRVTHPGAALEGSPVRHPRACVFQPHANTSDSQLKRVTQKCPGVPHDAHMWGGNRREQETISFEGGDPVVHKDEGETVGNPWMFVSDRSSRMVSAGSVAQGKVIRLLREVPALAPSVDAPCTSYRDFTVEGAAATAGIFVTDTQPTDDTKAVTPPVNSLPELGGSLTNWAVQSMTSQLHPHMVPLRQHHAQTMDETRNHLTAAAELFGGDDREQLLLDAAALPLLDLTTSHLVSHGAQRTACHCPPCVEPSAEGHPLKKPVELSEGAQAPSRMGRPITDSPKESDTTRRQLQERLNLGDRGDALLVSSNVSGEAKESALGLTRAERSGPLKHADWQPAIATLSSFMGQQPASHMKADYKAFPRSSSSEQQQSIQALSAGSPLHSTGPCRNTNTSQVSRESAFLEDKQGSFEGLNQLIRGEAVGRQSWTGCVKHPSNAKAQDDFAARDFQVSGPQSASRSNTAELQPAGLTGSELLDLAGLMISLNMQNDADNFDLLNTFSAFGRVELTVVVCDKEHRHPNREWTATSGYGFVRFVTSAEAAQAVQAAAMGSIRLRGSRIRATWARKDSLAKHSLSAAYSGRAQEEQLTGITQGRTAQTPGGSALHFKGLRTLLETAPLLLSRGSDPLFQEHLGNDPPTHLQQQQQQRGQQQPRRRHKHSRGNNDLAEAAQRNGSTGT
ncbi:RNA recognition motif-containing protein [Cyclospora cayetanensis]|uniref:RNA recognition motif-containing protein n=1 Tax=Cyclospora cayetanensis TaxID=88456 RepID=A0A1D3D3T0_9EIME|nr:RNA recognition motif-containing protein [Cyclospora cayetanensis]